MISDSRDRTEQAKYSKIKPSDESELLLYELKITEEENEEIQPMQ